MKWIIPLLLSLIVTGQAAVQVFIPALGRQSTPIVTPEPTVQPTPIPTLEPSPAPPPLPSPEPTPQPSPAPPTGANVRCQTFGAEELCAWVSNGSPGNSSEVIVYGRYLVNGQPVGGQAMQTVWRYKTTSPSCSGATGANGIAQCSRNIGRPSAGFQVNIEVTIAGRKVTTFFVPG